MFETVFTDVAQQFLQSGNFHYAGAAKRFERIVSEAAAASVATDISVRIVGRKSRETHGAGFHPSNTSAKCIVFANGARDDRLIFSGQIFVQQSNHLLASDIQDGIFFFGHNAREWSDLTGSLVTNSRCRWIVGG